MHTPPSEQKKKKLACEDLAELLRLAFFGQRSAALNIYYPQASGFSVFWCYLSME